MNNKNNSKEKGVLCHGFTFGVGQLLRYGLTVFLVTEDHGEFVVVQNHETLERKTISKDMLHQAYLEHNLVPCTEKDACRAIEGEPFVEDDNPVVHLYIANESEAVIAHGTKVVLCIKELEKKGYSNLRPTNLLKIEFERMQGKLAEENPHLWGRPITLGTVYKYSLKIGKADGDLRAAFPNYGKRGGKNRSRSDIRAQAGIKNVLDLIAKDPKAKIKFSDIEKNLKTELLNTVPALELFEVMPSRSTIVRETRASFSEYEIAKRNRGKKYAQKVYGSYYPRDRAFRPLEIVEFDDKDTRVFLIDDRTGLPYGRAFITSGIDQDTTVPLGFSISEKHRNRWSALNAYANCLLPKNLADHEYSEVKTAAEFWGNIGLAVFDNALQNHSNDMTRGIKELSNAIPTWSQPRQPRQKSCVEDFNGRMDASFLSTLPGYGGEKSSKDGLNAGLASAIMTIDTFKMMFYKWVYDEYSITPRAEGYTPRQAWHESMQNVKQRLPASLHKMRAAIALEHRIKFRTDGILFTGLQYQNPRLMLLRKKIGATAFVTFRYNPDRLELIYVYDPYKDEHFIVASVDPDYTRNLTLYQQTLILKMARLKGEKNPSIPQMLTCRKELQLLTSQLRNSKKRRERQQAIKNGFTEHEALKGQESTSQPLMTDLDHQIDEINSTVMEAGDEGWYLPDDL